jgi:hypothetical protein
MTNATYSRFRVTVSMWRKSIASRLSAWARRKVRQVSSRWVDGGTPLAHQIKQAAPHQPVIFTVRVSRRKFRSPSLRGWLSESFIGKCSPPRWCRWRCRLVGTGPDEVGDADKREAAWTVG